MARVSLDIEDAVELADLCELCCDWFDHDRNRLHDSLWRFSLVRLGEARDDLRRHIDLLRLAVARHEGGQR